MKRKVFLMLGLAMVTLLALSCVSVGPTRLSRGDDLGDPSTHTLAFGYLGRHTSLGRSALNYTRFIQLNPQHEAMFTYAVRPRGNNGLFYMAPMPVGSSWKFFSYSITSGNTITYYYNGLVGKSDWDPRMTRPGLMYIGAYARQPVTVDEGTPAERIINILAPVEDEGFELQALRAMRPQFAKTAWADLIDRRIQELTNE